MSRAKEQPVISAEELVSHSDAEAIARRFINGHFKNGGGREGPRMSIPARPDQDDDLRLLAYIRQQTALAEENARLREACTAAIQNSWLSASMIVAKSNIRRGGEISETDKSLASVYEQLSSALSNEVSPDPRDEQIRKLTEALTKLLAAHSELCEGNPEMDADDDCNAARAALASRGGK